MECSSRENGRFSGSDIPYCPTKTTPTTKAFTGLEGDKMDASITEFHFSQAMGSLLKRCDENGYELSGIFLDSYEAATQTWTQRFPRRVSQTHGI